jgi:hypothetical protein
MVEDVLVFSLYPLSMRVTFIRYKGPEHEGDHILLVGLSLWICKALPPVITFFHTVGYAQRTWLSSLLLLVFNTDYLLQLPNVKTDGFDSGKGLQRKNAWRRRKDEMKVQVRFQREDLGIYFQTCLSLLCTLGKGGRHDKGRISCSWILNV